MTPSTRFTLNRDDIMAWLKNSAIFFAPFALVFLVEVQSGRTMDDAFTALKLYALNVAIDLIRKFVAGKPQA
jgi:hypothetical protein